MRPRFEQKYLLQNIHNCRFDSAWIPVNVEQLVLWMFMLVLFCFLTASLVENAAALDTSCYLFPGWFVICLLQELSQVTNKAPSNGIIKYLINKNYHSKNHISQDSSWLPFGSPLFINPPLLEINIRANETKFNEWPLVCLGVAKNTGSISP